MIDVAGRFTLDFWSVMVAMTVEQSIDLERTLSNYAEIWTDTEFTGSKQCGFRVQPWNNKSYRERMYLVSIWGPFTRSVVSFERRLQIAPTRVDLRFETLVAGKHFNAWKDAMVRAYNGRKNINSYNSRPRAKNESRDRGGSGVAFGSLRSQERLSVYCGYPETLVAVEFQFRHERATAVGNAYLDIIRSVQEERGNDAMPREEEAVRALWECFAEERVVDVLGYGLAELKDMVVDGGEALAKAIYAQGQELIERALVMKASMFSPSK